MQSENDKQNSKYGALDPSYERERRKWERQDKRTRDQQAYQKRTARWKEIGANYD